MKCPICREHNGEEIEMEWTRYKDVRLEFESASKFVTVEAYLCPECGNMEAWIK